MGEVKQNYEHYNFQARLIQNIADGLFDLEYKISKAYEERPSAFVNALSSSRIFVDKLIGMDLKIKKNEIKKLNLYLDIAQRYYERNQFLEGCKYLSLAFRKIWNIIKLNDMAFPRSRKVTSFKDWAEQQL